MPTYRRAITVTAVVVLSALAGALAPAAPASTLPPGFQESVVFSGLANPTVVRFSPDGRVFVAQKDGRILVFDSLTDTTPTLFADLRPQVHNFWDRGMLGMALDPNFPATPDVYVLYTYDAAIGGITPTVGRRAAPDPARPTTDGCVVSGRLSRLTASGNVMTGSEQVLINDWCQQFPSHSVGSIEFGPDGALYVDRRRRSQLQLRRLRPDEATRAATRPAARAPTSPRRRPRAARCAARTCAAPATRPGSTAPLLRHRPDDRARRLPGNPLRPVHTDANAAASSRTGCATRSARPSGPGRPSCGSGTSAGARGRRSTASSTSPTNATNFGWPCYEGTPAQPRLRRGEPHPVREPLHRRPERRDGAALRVQPLRCGRLRVTDARSATARPSRAWPSTSAQRHLPGRLRRRPLLRRPQPQLHLGHARRRRRGASASLRAPFMSGAPDRSTCRSDSVATSSTRASTAGTVRRISYPVSNRVPTAVARANPTSGSAPLAVAFDGTGSSDPDPADRLTLRVGSRRRWRI